MSCHRSAIATGAALLVIGTPIVCLGQYKTEVGYTALQAELGGSTPTGAGVPVSHVEPLDGDGDYTPNTGAAQFSNNTFTLRSGPNNPSGDTQSGHATTVGGNFYGSNSLAPGVTAVDNWSASHWINEGWLNALTNAEPLPEPARVQNHSWISAVDYQDPPVSDAAAIDVLRRYDYAINRDGFTAVVGLNNFNANDANHPKIFSNAYNVIAVGMSNGGHSIGVTEVDAPGRVKPDLVAPASATSYATPIVGAAAAMLHEAAAGAANPANARQPETIKALLMAGATKSEFPGWDRTQTRPLDEVYGAGELNIQRSYHTLAAGEHAASGNSTVPARGWDFGQSGESPSLYFFDVAPDTELGELSVLLTWNRVIADGNPAPGQWSDPTATLADMDLRLYSATGFSLDTLLDASLSTVDNVEHLYLADGLSAGRYAFEITSDLQDYDYALAWYSTTIPIPEPAGLAALGTGLVLLSCRCRRRRRR